MENVLTDSAVTDDTSAETETPQVPVVDESQESAAPATDTGETPETEEAEPKPSRTFTQEELDAILGKSRNRFERKHRNQIATLTSKLEQLEKAQVARGEQATATDDAPKEPKRSEYETYEDYIEAKADHKAGERIRKEIANLTKSREAETYSRQEEIAREKLIKTADQRVKDGRKEYPDFDVVVQEAFDDEIVTPQSELYFGIIDSPVGHRIIMHLAKHPDLAEQLNNMSPRGLHRELGKLEEKFSKAPEKRKANTMEPLNGSGNAYKSNDPMRDNLSMDEFVRLRNAQERKLRGL